MQMLQMDCARRVNLILFIFCLEAAASARGSLRFKVDASAEGCTGLFWREWSPHQRRFVVAKSQSDPPWPRNGAVVEGTVSGDRPGWLLLAGGRALPFHDEAGEYTYLHAISEQKTGLLPPSEPNLSNPFDLVILGSGPAGLTAAVYARRAGRSALVVGGPEHGGAMMLSRSVENVPFAEVGAGASHLGRLMKQAASFGASFHHGSAAAVLSPGGRAAFEVQLDDGGRVHGQSVIVATGAEEKWLGLPGESELRGSSLHTCAYCDAHFYEGAVVCVVGGGDGALEAASYLARVAKSVTLIHRRTSWRGSAAGARRVERLSSVRVLRPYEVSAWLPAAEQGLAGASLRHAAGGPELRANCSGAFVTIGREPRTHFLPSAVRRDTRGFVLLAEHTMTSLPGLFAAGQVADARYQQAVTAAAGGAQAAMDASRWLDRELDSGGPTQQLRHGSPDSAWASPGPWPPDFHFGAGALGSAACALAAAWFGARRLRAAGGPPTLCVAPKAS